MMATFFLILIALAVFHLFYESVIAPSMRLELRFRLFALRDRLRRQEIECSPESGENVYATLESSINGGIKYMRRFDLTSVGTAILQLEKNEKLTAEVKRRHKLIDECPNNEVRVVRDELNRLMVYGLVVNSGGWLYLFPFIYGFGKLRGMWSSFRSLAYVKESEMQWIMPHEELVLR